MKLIAHRGNIQGPDPTTENKPEQIEACLDAGYDVEIDLWYDEEGTLWLGHDQPQYQVTWWWLAGKSSNLWIHCKDLELSMSSLLIQVGIIISSIKEMIIH